MAEKAQIILNWTPVATATVQKIYRSSTSNTGPWTLVHTINNGSTNTWTDTTVDPTPMEQYYYYIETTCSTGTSDSNVDYDLCNNCDEGNDNQSLFIFKNNNTTDANSLVYFTYENYSKAYWNATYGTSLNTTTTIGIGQTPNSGYNKYVACHTCGEPVTMALPNPLVTESGTYNGTLNADYTHSSEQNIENFLPGSASGFQTTYDKRGWAFDAGNNSGLAHTVNNGHFWLGKTFNTINPTSFSAINPPNNYNLGEMQVNQMRLSRITEIINSVSTNYSTSLSGFTSNSGGDAFMLIRPQVSTCIYWLFKVTRNSNYDVYSGATLEMYGYDIQYINTFDYNSYYFIGPTDTTNWGHLPKNSSQSFTFKFIKTTQIDY
jgi:hypothetical protein